MTSQSEVEIKLLPTQQTKLTLIRALSGHAEKNAIETILKMLAIAHMKIEQSAVETLRDEYLDTIDFRILGLGASLRIRHRGKQMSLEYKSQNTNTDVGSPGLFDRQEQMTILAVRDYRSLVDDGKLPTQSASWFGRDIGQLRVVCEVTDNRSIFVMRRREAAFQLSLDRCVFFDPRVVLRSRKDFLELEIEAINAEGVNTARELRDEVCNILSVNKQFVFSTDTKYQTAVRELRLRKSMFFRRLLGREAELGIGVTLIGIVVAVIGVHSPIIAGGVAVALLIGLLLAFRTIN